MLDNKCLVGYTQIVQSSKHRTKKGGAVMAYRIRELREKKKLTQEQLAQMSGVSRTTIVLLENNEEHEAINVAGQQANPMDELAFQVSRRMAKIAQDIEYTFINGKYAKN